MIRVIFDVGVHILYDFVMFLFCPFVGIQNARFGKLLTPNERKRHDLAAYNMTDAAGGFDFCSQIFTTLCARIMSVLKSPKFDISKFFLLTLVIYCIIDSI